MIVGASLGKEIDDFLRTQYCAINSPDAPNADQTCNPSSAQYTVSQFNPNFSILPPLLSFGPGVIGPSSRARNYVTGIGSGAYVSDLMTINDHWKVLAGVRYAHEDQMNYADKLEPSPVVGDAHLVSSATLPQVGLIYQPTQRLSFYASYSTSFSPVPPGTQDPNGSYNFEPTRGLGYEVGAKTVMFGGALTATAALFRIDQTNVIVPSASSNCSTGSCSEQIGGARSEGLELEASARPTPEWTIVAGYAHTNARVTSNPKAAITGPLVGGELPNSPLDAAHLWSRYDFTDVGLPGFGIGLGYSYVSSRVAYTPTTSLPHPFIVPAYNVFDLGLYYSIRKVDFTLKINNLLDTNYYFSGTVTQGKVNVQPGTPRTAMLTASYKF
jgi:iron complex outermembrane receptor protein